MMRIKKHPNGNEYLLTKDGIWVRNFNNKVAAVDINSLTDRQEYGMMVENEIKNNRMDIAEFNPQMVKFENAVIVSDGYGFKEKEELLSKITNAIIIATNRSLAKWKTKRKIDFFVANNPYQQCMLQMPEKYFPKCLASSKTYPPFLKEYDEHGGMIFKYSPVSETRFAAAPLKAICVIDDYRNPICAAIGFANLLGVKRLLLFCCDDVFNTQRPGAEQLPNGLWIYPQHLLSHRIIEANLYWYKRKEKTKITLGNHSSGLEYEDVPYITTEGLTEFFNK